MVNWIAVVIGGVSAVAGLYFLLAGAGRLHGWKTLRDTSAGAVTGPGAVEVEGVAKSHRETLDPPRETADSLAYEYEVEKRKLNPDEDDVGDEWDTVDEGRDSVPFVVDDGADGLLVDPEGADFLFGEDIHTQPDKERRYTVGRVDVGEQVYVAGEAAPAAEADLTPDGQRYVVTGTRSLLGRKLGGLTGTPFVISDSGEERAEARLIRRALLYLGVGVLLLGMSGVALFVIG